ncbi:MAG: GNAT family N-acetyltransferase [Bacilli bacterium]|nr:GNAT family N-acetyltransferase [Bacilli bacterium]
MVEAKFYFGVPEDACAIRDEVFTMEQGFSDEIEYDEHDPNCWHVVLYLDGFPIATGRVFAEDPELYHIGRLAVRKAFRGQKVGTYAMKFLETKAKSLGARRLVLGAQLDKAPFYEKNGYSKNPTGEIYEEEGVPHILMFKTLKSRKRK